MKNSISSDVLVGRLSEICENQSVIISGIGKLLSMLSENDSKLESISEDNMTTVKETAIETNNSIANTEAVVVASPKRRGRPAKVKNVDSENVKVSKKERSSKNSDDINSMKFSEVILHIAKISKKPMKVAGFVETALKLGYKSDAKDFANITYQYLHNMFKKGLLNKNDNNEYFN